MTKQQIIEEATNLAINSSLSNQIWDMRNYLIDSNCVTSGYAFHTHSVINNYHYDWFSKTLEKATKAKSYSNYLKRISKWDYEYHYKKLKEEINKIYEDYCEQMLLPFEETQMQVLITSGELIKH